MQNLIPYYYAIWWIYLTCLTHQNYLVDHKARKLGCCLWNGKCTSRVMLTLHSWPTVWSLEILSYPDNFIDGEYIQHDDKKLPFINWRLSVSLSPTISAFFFIFFKTSSLIYSFLFLLSPLFISLFFIFSCLLLCFFCSFIQIIIKFL